MRNIVRDIKTTASLFHLVHQATKRGVDIQVKTVRSIPVINFGYWGWTMEASLFYEKKWKPLRDVFDTFDEETQHALTFAPKDGEWPDRVRFWQKKLRPVLEPKLYHEAMLKLIQWGICCLKKRQEGAA